MQKRNIDPATVRKEVSYIGARLREPSTYNAMAILAGVLGFSVGQPVVSAIAAIGAGVGALIGALMPEGKMVSATSIDVFPTARAAFQDRGPDETPDGRRPLSENPAQEDRCGL